jgi:hypothetical protein
VSLRVSALPGASVELGGIVVSVLTGVSGTLEVAGETALALTQGNFRDFFAKANFDPKLNRMGLFLPLVVHGAGDSQSVHVALLAAIEDVTGGASLTGLYLRSIVDPHGSASNGTVAALFSRAVLRRSVAAKANGPLPEENKNKCCEGAWMCKCCNGQICFLGDCPSESCNSCVSMGCQGCINLSCPMLCGCASQ